MRHKPLFDLDCNLPGVFMLGSVKVKVKVIPRLQLGSSTVVFVS